MGLLLVQAVTLNIPGDAWGNKIADGPSFEAALSHEAGRHGEGVDGETKDPAAFPGRRSRRGKVVKPFAHRLGERRSSSVADLVWALDDPEVELGEKFGVVPPRVELGKRIGAYEEHGPEPLLAKGAQRVDRVPVAAAGDLERRDREAGYALGGESQHLEAVVARGETPAGLVRWLRARQEEHALDAERAARSGSQDDVTAMNGIEAPAEDRGRGHPVAPARPTASAAARKSGVSPVPETAETTWSDRLRRLASRFASTRISASRCIESAFVKTRI